MTRQEWTAEFYRLFAARTVFFNWDTALAEGRVQPDEAETYKDYTDMDWSVPNEWVDGDKLCYGSVYRKEVCPMDTLGSYQYDYFKIVDGKVTEIGDRYPNAAQIGNMMIRQDLDLYSLFPDPAVAISAFYQEVGMQY